MTKLELGPIGVALSPRSGQDWNACLAAAPELERLGYSTIWLSGGMLTSLDQIADLIRVTKQVRVGPAIIPVDRYPSDAVARTYTEIEATHPGRFVVGLGGAHGRKPLQTLGSYLDRLDDAPAPVPAASRVLAALGPRMLAMARDRTAGAFPMLVTPEYTTRARNTLGNDASLIIGQCLALDADAARARNAAQDMIGFLLGVPGYSAHFRRIGFTDEEITQRSDRLVDALVAWGDLDTITDRVRQQLAAGADQVVLTVLDTGTDTTQALRAGQWRVLAEALLPMARTD
jgi:probable F420-dependent oxidoreductase